jgi:glycosyltransferase involved in cell wall biosynthesis
MHVGIVTPRYPPTASGGGEVSVRMLAEHLDRGERVDSVAVLSFDGQGRERHNGVEVRRLADVSPTITELQNLRAYPHIRSQIDEFDIVHAYNMELHPAVGALGRSRGVATVGTLNSYHFFPKSVANATPGTLERAYELVGHPTTNRVLQHYLKRIDTFVAISEAVRSVYRGRGYDDVPIEVVPNMLDPSFDASFEAAARTVDADGDAGFTVLYVGELSERKGVAYLVRALEHLPESYELRVVGDGPRRQALERLAAPLSDRVTFTGQVPYDEVTSQYARADVFIHPGVWPEPFGRTVLEAMQAGLPVVCTDVGGPADIVPQPDLRCPPRDPEALAAAVERARDRGTRVGERNREHAHREYAPDTVVSRIVDVYRRVA